MKKTLLLTHEYYPYRGGIGTYCYNLFKHYSPHDYLVATDQREIPDNNPVIRVRLVSSIMRPRWLMGCLTVARIVRKYSIEQIVTPHILPLGRIAYVLKRILGIPYIISLHGFDINLALERKEKITRKILSSAHAIIVNSHATKEIVDGLHLKHLVEVITPYYNATLVNKDLETKLKEQYAGKKVILTTGRLVKRKGQDMIIQALPGIVKRVPMAHYVMVGDGPDKEYLQQLAKDYGVMDRVTFVPDVADADLGAYYSVASLFAMPARRIGPDMEGFGIVYLDAASFGLPVIAGNSGGEAEAVGDGSAGLIVNVRSLEQIIESIVNILEDPELAHYLGENARERLKQLPTWDDQAQKLGRILS